MRTVVTLIALACATAAGQGSPTAPGLLQRMLELKKQNLAERSRYFAREDIRVVREKDGQRTPRSWNTYEAAVLDGRIRYKLVARNGKPLAAKSQKLQPEGARYEVQWEQVLAHHNLRLLGTESIGGRAAWHVAARLKPSAPRPVVRQDMALAGSWDIWIDQATGQESRTRLLVERDWLAFTAGSTLETESTLQGALFLPARSVVRRRDQSQIIETEQMLTGYRRFSSESVLLPEP